MIDMNYANQSYLGAWELKANPYLSLCFDYTLEVIYLNYMNKIN